MRLTVAQRHLIPLEDALESLWFHLENLLQLEDGSNRASVPCCHLEVSLSVLATALAQKRRRIIEGTNASTSSISDAFAGDLGCRLEFTEKAIGADRSSGVRP